ncbi:hypothetical protein [Furfurilactobacillus milii]|uniref:Uncharacterized protein n=1 Tax=Furfurilactobacillus rossiae TaxID=231049 RepID=A0A7C9IQY7_9LACO|nr:hypothetical protein [Furfurilactobacillus milii]MYV04454.1 hypothetical protein [Furfurilactobacillus milii]
MINQSYVLAHRKPFNERFGMFLWPYDHSGYNAVFFKKQLDAALDLGVGLISIGSRPDNANDDVGAIDGAFDMAQNAGMAVRTTLGAGAALNGDAVDYPNHIHDMDDWNKRYVQHLAGRNLIWDASNEANNPGFWYGKSSYYDHSLIKDWLGVDKVLYDYVRQYDPGSIFLNGDLFRSPYDLQKGQWADEWDAMVQYGMMSFGDAISVHPYLEDAVTGYPHSPESLLQYMATPDNATLPLVVTEFSYNRSTMDVNQQADWLARSWFIFDYMQVPFVIHYGFWDEYLDDNGGYSIFDHDWNPYPAANTLKYWLYELKGYYFNQRFSTGNDSTDFVFEYVSGTTHKIIGWTSDSSRQITVNGNQYTITNTPVLLNTFEEEVTFNKITNIYQLKDTFNENIDIASQVLNSIGEDFIDFISLYTNIQKISSESIGNSFRNQLIISLTEIQKTIISLSNLSKMIGITDDLGNFYVPEKIAMPNSLMIDNDFMETLNNDFDSLAQVINFIKKGV